MEIFKVVEVRSNSLLGNFKRIKLGVIGRVIKEKVSRVLILNKRKGIIINVFFLIKNLDNI